MLLCRVSRGVTIIERNRPPRFDSVLKVLGATTVFWAINPTFARKSKSAVAGLFDIDTSLGPQGDDHSLSVVRNG